MARRWIPRFAAVALAAAAVWWWQRQQQQAAEQSLESSPTWSASLPRPPATPAAPPSAAWRAPVDGGCPDGYPVKVARSGIFHEPGGRSYERTTPDRCYATAADAEADGYRRAKA